MQPIATVTVRRPWRWGIAILSDAEVVGIPDVDPHGSVSSGMSGLVVSVRHAYDTDPEDADRTDGDRTDGESAAGEGPDADRTDAESARHVPGDAPMAEAGVTVTSWPSAPDVERPGILVFDGPLLTPSGRLTLGDAEQKVTLACPTGATHVRVVVSDDVAGPMRAWMDIHPAAPTPTRP